MFHNTFDELLLIGDERTESESHPHSLLQRVQALFSKSTLVKRLVSIAKDNVPLF